MIAAKLRAAGVIARRDFLAVVWSKGFVLFLLAPLFMAVIGVFAGSLGNAAQDNAAPAIGLAMPAADARALIAARDRLEDRMAGPVPQFTVLSHDPDADGRALLRSGGGHLAGVVTGRLAAPVLTTTGEWMDIWQGMLSEIAARARAPGAAPFVKIRTQMVMTSAAHESLGQQATGQAGQTLLFLLTMLLAGMVLSNLVEEKGNKIIEILAAAIPMDALFVGKLVAMLAVSFVGIAVWGTGIGVLVLTGARALPALATPAVGWPVFVGLAVAYFSLAYLLLGSVYLTIGSMAATVRDVQTLALPASLLQVAMFGFASYAIQRRGTGVDLSAMLFPLSSPYAMIGHAAVDGAMWPHVLAILWQGGWTLAIVAMGSRLFRRRVMKSGPAAGRTKKKG